MPGRHWPLAPTSAKKAGIVMSCAVETAFYMHFICVVLYIVYFNPQPLGLQEINRFRVLPRTTQVAPRLGRFHRPQRTFLAGAASFVCVFGLAFVCVWTVWTVLVCAWAGRLERPPFLELRWEPAVPNLDASILSACALAELVGAGRASIFERF
jgi:hypothetical protein